MKGYAPGSTFIFCPPLLWIEQLKVTFFYKLYQRGDCYHRTSEGIADICVLPMVSLLFSVNNQNLSTILIILDERLKGVHFKVFS